MPSPDTATALITALAALWRRIQEQHPDVPPVVLLPAPGPRHVLGHFAPLRWKAKGDAAVVLHEVVVVAEHLSRRADEIAETVLHEAVHAMNFARGIKDCSTTSQYHNDHFRRAALEVGLTVEKVPNYGWALTAMPPETAEKYQEEIDGLAIVLVHRRSPVAAVIPTTPGVAVPPDAKDKKEDNDEHDDTDAKPKGRLLKAVCKCGFIIRASRLVLDTITITCSRCETKFRASA